MSILMACTNPLKAFTIGTNKDTGKAKLKITGRDVTYLLRDGHSWLKCYDPVPEGLPDDKDHIYSYDLLPCGSCYSCRMTKARDWTVRCMLESQYHDDNYFITLTYADSSLPSNFDELSGEFTGKSSLCKADLQKFFKRLRENYSFDNHISMLSCGEYGSISYRPHYHSCVFGLKLDDLKVYKKTDLGYSLYTSEFLNKCWSRDPRKDEEPDFYNANGHGRVYLGFVIVAPLTYESAAYVARYTVKKQGDIYKDIYDDYLIVPEFILSSRRPSIGLQYYEDHRDEIYKYDAIYLPDGKVVKPPAYFDKLYERDFPDKMVAIKEQRKKLAEISFDNLIGQTDYDFDQFMAVKDYVYKERTKSLLRKEL